MVVLLLWLYMKLLCASIRVPVFQGQQKEQTTLSWEQGFSYVVGRLTKAQRALVMGDLGLGESTICLGEYLSWEI